MKRGPSSSCTWPAANALWRDFWQFGQPSNRLSQWQSPCRRAVAPFSAKKPFAISSRESRNLHLEPPPLCELNLGWFDGSDAERREGRSTAKTGLGRDVC